MKALRLSKDTVGVFPYINPLALTVTVTDVLLLCCDWVQRCEYAIMLTAVTWHTGNRGTSCPESF